MTDYTLLKAQLRQKQIDLRGQEITRIPQSSLRGGIQGLPQRKEIAHFNRRLREQQRKYGEQIKAIDKYLYLEAQKEKILSQLMPDDPIPTFEPNPKPNISFYPNLKLKMLRNRFSRRASWY